MIRRKLSAAILAALLVALVLPVPVAATGDAVDDEITVLEDSAAAPVDVLANDASSPTVTAVSDPANGTATFDAGGVTYAPDPDFNGEDTFTYTINGGPDSATVTVTVTLVNDAPSFTKGADETVDEDAGPQSVSDWATAISSGPADEAGQALAFALTAADPSLFSAGPAVSAAGTLTYTPAPNANGSTSVDISLSDDGGTVNGGVDTSATQSFTITLTPQNDNPTANNDTATVAEDSAATPVDVLANDSSAPDTGETLSVTGVGTASHGTATLVAGVVRYAPTADYNGSDSFSYTIDDGNGGTATATVDVTVTPVNDNPTAVDDPVTLDEDAGATVIDVLANDLIAPDAGETLSVTNVGLASHGTATLVAGVVRYAPAADDNGSDSFTYTISDGNGGTGSASVLVTVTPVNDAPSFTRGADQTVLEDVGGQSVPGWATGISAGPADEAGQLLSFNVSAGNPALFSVQPAIAANGTLTYTPATNANGTTTITVSLVDNGGTANGGIDASADQAFDITVTAANDAPSFTKGADQNLSEGAGAQTVPGWATAISAGPADESGQALTFHVSADNTALFSVQPAIAANGALTYTPASNANGLATVSVYLTDDGGTANGGVDTSATQTFQVSIGAVNDAPSFTRGADQTVAEDSGLRTVTGWATSISAGPADESSQVLTFHVSGDNAALFSVQPDVDEATGTLTFTPATNANGSATVSVYLTDDGGTANGGADTSATQQLTITVTPVNDAPSFTKGADQTVGEDAGPQTVAGWATAISKGPANESSQALAFHLAAVDPSLFSTQPAVNPATGTLTYTPAANANGTTSVDVHLTDDGGTSGGGVDTSATVSFTVTITAVNDTPSFTKGANQSVGEDAGAQTVPGWATAISKGAANESSQVLTFHVSADTTALFSVQPDVDEATGTLTYTPAANANGSATVSIFLTDDGGGADTSASQQLTITVTAVNDAPAYTAGADQEVLEDAGPQTVTGWATGMSSGPANEASQVLVFSVAGTTNSGLFAAGPAVDPVTGDLTWTPAADANGSATVTLRLADGGGTSGGGVDHVDHTFTVTVTPVNDAPAFTDGGDVSAGRDDGTGSVQAIAGWATAISAGPADEASQGLAFTVTGTTNPTLFQQPPAVDASGTLTFWPAVNTSGSSDITIVLADDGGTADGGADTSVEHTFTITVSGENQTPVPGNDLVTVRLAGPAVIDVMANDSGGTGEPGDPIHITRAYGAKRGFLTIAPDGSSVTYDPFGCSTGTDLFTYTVEDGGGKTASASVLVTIASPSSLPAADGPRPSLVTGSTIGSKVPVRLAWCGLTGKTGLKKYVLAQAVNGGTWSTVITGTTATSTTRSLGVSPTRFAFRLKVVDRKSRSAYGYGPTTTVTRLQENSTAITYAGSWGTKSAGKASGDRMRFSSSTSASASFTVSGTRQVGIVGPKGSTYGSFKVYLNGSYVGKFSERGSSAYRKVLYVRSLDPGRTYTIKLKPAGNGRVYLDAVVTLR